MTVAMQVVQIIFQTVAILFMLTFMFIGIWSFILFIKMYKNQRVHNFLLQKINNSISNLEFTKNEEHSKDLAFDLEDTFLNDSFSDDNRDKVIRIDEA